MYTVSRNGETMGPWAIEEIARKLAATELSVTDFAWDDAADDWTPLMDFAPLKAHLQSLKPGRPSTKAVEKTIESTVTKIQAADVTEAKAVGTEERPEWYVSRGQQKFGPFTYFGVIKALQDKAVYEFDYIWTNGMESWVRIAEHERFGSETIRELMKTAEGAAVFAKRKHTRILLENDVLVHDNNSVSPGRMVEASEGGSGLVVRNSALIPGQMVNVHFSSLEGLPAFNAIGEVVSKKFAKGTRDRRAPIHYGIRFVKMDQKASERVREFLKEKTGRAAA
jgi:hypothetical protein